MNRAPHLRLVHNAAEKPAPWRLEVMIGVSDRRRPHGRSRTFLLRPECLEQLLAAAQRLEVRR